MGATHYLLSTIALTEYHRRMGLLRRAAKSALEPNKRRALIIGGSGGIGRAVTRELARRGAAVICHGGRDRGKIRETVAWVRARGGEARGFLLHLEQAADVLPYLNYFAEVDIVVVAFGPVVYGTLAHTSPHEWRRAVELNLTLPGVVVSHYLPRMVRRGWGRIMLFGGPHSARIRGYTAIAAYGAAKLGLASLVRSAAVEARGANVTVNAIAPGYVDTEYLTPQRRAAARQRTPAERLITHECIARLAGDIIFADQPDMNGAVFAVDQGIV